MRKCSEFLSINFFCTTICLVVMVEEFRPRHLHCPNPIRLLVIRFSVLTVTASFRAIPQRSFPLRICSYGSLRIVYGYQLPCILGDTTSPHDSVISETIYQSLFIPYLKDFLQGLIVQRSFIILFLEIVSRSCVHVPLYKPVPEHK